MASPGIETNQATPVPPSARKPLPWLTLAVLAGLLFAVYAQVLITMVREWFTLDEMGHGIFVPLVVGYMVWQKRDELAKLKPRPAWWGLILVGWGFVQMVLGIVGADFFVARTAFLVSLLGVILTVGGVAVVRTLAFPLFLLLFMIRIPLFIYSQITFPLQILASKLAEIGLGLVGIPVLRDGNILEVASQRLTVVEACSGIRSLLSLSFLSLVYAYFFDRKLWMRPVLLVATVPIAILANGARVTITGVLTEYNTQLAEGVYHSLEGWVIFMISLMALIVLHQGINRIYGWFDARRSS